MSLRDELKTAKDAAATSATNTIIDLEGDQVQAYTNLKVNDAVEKAVERTVAQQKEIVDQLSIQVESSNAAMEEKDKEIKDLKEKVANTSESSKSTAEDSENLDVKKLMSKIYNRLQQKFAGGGEEMIKHSELMKTVKVILKQVATESETPE